ncbi:MAG TPA: hypothetical protein VNH15_07000 [Elusimicrobiota bacterium]|nr:hypothetical protein [Elusimicrobiota bacterium]
MIFLTIALLFAPAAHAQENPPVVSTDAVLPSYLALEPDIHNFNLFADGGPDSNWYVGFNNAWIVKLPTAPAGQFSRAFVGAKLGRAKTQPDPDAPWRRDVVDGQIYMAISPAPAFSPEQSYFLAQTEDIPREADPQSNVLGVGASRWFWAEVPLDQINFSGPNYLIIWSPSPDLSAATNAPILAASDRSSFSCDPNGCAWNNNSIQGAPPRQADGSLQTPLSNLMPALAIELVPVGERPAVKVFDLTVSPQGAGALVRFSVSGQNISRAWLEISQDDLDWQRVGPFLESPPFIFTLDSSQAPKSGQYLRAAAQDIDGDEGHSVPYAAP